LAANRTIWPGVFQNFEVNKVPRLRERFDWDREADPNRQEAARTQ